MNRKGKRRSEIEDEGEEGENAVKGKDIDWTMERRERIQIKEEMDWGGWQEKKEEGACTLKLWAEQRPALPRVTPGEGRSLHRKAWTAGGKGKGDESWWAG